MVTRIEVATTVFDTRAAIRQKRFADFPFHKKIKNVFLIDVYTIDKPFSSSQLHEIGSRISNPVTQSFLVKTKGQKSEKLLVREKKFEWVIEIGFLPGVTDNVSHTTREMIQDLFGVKFSSNEDTYTSQATFIDGDLSKSEVEEIASSLYNPLIQSAHIKNYNEFIRDGGMDFVIPKVNLQVKPNVLEVDLNIPDEDLAKIGKEGILDANGKRRGPLALSLEFMKTIQAYFKVLKRIPTDIEIESIAQTWSEHCKHTIFNDPIDDIEKGLFKTYIRRATEEIRKQKGKEDFCVSVFTDNSGGISFDRDWIVTHKAETHNSPSALDPFGGAITGIVGVNRDAMGFGLGAKPVANYYGFCFADPKKDIPLYRGANQTQKMLSSRRIMDGVVDGVNAGGNQSGIPTPQGFVYFDESYRGKPLVFVGTVGLIPKKIKNKNSWEKKAMPGDLIVVVGGRVGKDGIHGATFSSEAMDSGSPATAVQIGDPITQKKLSDALIKEARDQFLYNSITDNGAGGLSCSVAEMAKESGGCIVDLEKVPLKYSGLEPWEIWISESQERMTLAVHPKNWKKLQDLLEKRGVESTVIGEFTDSGKCIVRYQGKTIMDLSMEFLHNGLPKRPMHSREITPRNNLAKFDEAKNYNKVLENIMGRENIASFSFITRQYDHIVQGGLVLPPLQGKGWVNSDTSVFRPVLDSNHGVILSQGLYPTYSEIDTYDMAAASIDTAIRNAVAAGGDIDYLAILDNFCWPSGNDPERLYQLKNAAKACYDVAVSYGTPFISGKDSMFNDFKGYDKDGKSLKISVLPTLLVSAIGVVKDITKVVSLDAKNSGDLVYILGSTYDEIGGSEYLSMLNDSKKENLFDSRVPKVNTSQNKKLYKALFTAIKNNLVASSISITRGGLAVALAKKAIGGMLGLSIDLKKLPGQTIRDDFALFSESQGRILITVMKEDKEKFEEIMKGNNLAEIGKVTKEESIVIKGLDGKNIVNVNLDRMVNAYRDTFKNF